MTKHRNGRLALGLMSGTSGDGISIALCSFSHRRLKLLGYKTFPYPPEIRRQILKGALLQAGEISRLNMILGNFFALRVLAFLRQNGIRPGRIAVAGSHGQTLYHGPKDDPPNTLQIGEPCLIAEKTGIPVVADFRPRDVALGGGGAPLIPYFDQFFFGRGPVRALQNIGGAANISVVGRNFRTIAFDTGPGNYLIDWTIQKQSRGRLAFDKEGKIARQGSVIMRIVEEMIAHPYFHKKPPKSTGRELFNERFMPESLKELPTEDQIATLTYFTAYSIYKSYKQFVPSRITELIVSGGGARNLTLMKFLSDLFAPVPVTTIEKYGIPAQAKEPAAFAFFALRALQGKINHLPQGTGASRASILGKFIPASGRRTRGNQHAFS